MKSLLLDTFALLSALTTHRGESPDEAGKRSLHGLSSFLLVVPGVSEDATKDGLNMTHVRSLIDTTLAQAGIPLVKDAQQKDGFANLVVMIDLLKNPQGVYVFNIHVDVVQMVKLARDSKASALPVQTWDTVAMGLTIPSRFDVIDASLREKLADFVKAFKEANAH